MERERKDKKIEGKKKRDILFRGGGEVGKRKKKKSFERPHHQVRSSTRFIKGIYINHRWWGTTYEKCVLSGNTAALFTCVRTCV